MPNYYEELEKRKNELISESYVMAERHGVKGGEHNGVEDAFRHVYVSAKETRDNGTIYAWGMGNANEWKNEVDARVASGGKEGNPPGEWSMDDHNNSVGRELGRKARDENWDDDKLAQEVKSALDQGYVVTTPGGTAKEDPPKTSNPSILDYFPSGLPQPTEPQENTDEGGFFERLFGR